MQQYRDFGFYLFAKRFPYYALIWAKSIGDALRTYREEVCEEDEGEEFGLPEKLSFKEGLKEILNSTSEDIERDDVDAFYVIRSMFINKINQVVLISSDLI